MNTTRATILIFIFIGIIVLVLPARWNRTDGPPSPAAAATAPESLPGIRMSEAPWPIEFSHLLERLQMIGLPALRREGTAFHRHQHLDLFINGQAVTVPTGIGINPAAGFISPIHTHDASGGIHIESFEADRYTLGQFFDIWGVRFTQTCIGSYCNVGDKILRVYVNGSIVNSNIRDVVLENDQEIVLAYGTSKELPNPMPSKFKGPE